MPLPREEQETVVRIGFYDDTCSITTTNPTHAGHLMKRGLTPSISRIPTKWNETEDKKGRIKREPVEWEDTCWNFTAPADWFKLPRPKKQVSEEQKQAARERMKAMHAKGDDPEDDD